MQENFNPNVKSYFIKGENARTVANKLSQKMGKSLSNQNATFSTSNGLIVDYESIMVVENNYEDVAYSFKVDSDQENEATFQNLVMVDKNNQTITKLITYEMTPEFATLYNANLKDMTQFNGTITITTLDGEDCCGSSLVFEIGIGGGADGEGYDDGNGTGGFYGNNSGATGGWGFGWSGGGSSGGSSGSSGSGGGSSSCSNNHDAGLPTCECQGSSAIIISTRMSSSNNNKPITLDSPNTRDLCCIYDIGVYQDAMFTKDCENLKNLSQSTDQNVNQKIGWLKDKVKANNTIEWGSSFKRIGYYNNVTSQTEYSYDNSENMGTPNYVEMSISGDHVGGAHCHTTTGFQMYSFGDLHLLLDMHEATRVEHEQDVTFMLVAINPADANNPFVYALKIDNYEQFKQAHDAVWNNPKYAVTPTGNPVNDFKTKMDLIHNEQALDYKANSTDLNKHFVEKYTSSFGLNLYKAEDDLSNWNKLELANGPTPGSTIVDSKPCN